MKKVLFALAALLMSATMFAQTFVSTQPANKNVILEEYTGINCGYCPQGHKIANDIMAANPGRAWAINVHQGSYAANTYTTQWGNALANQTGLTGYPSGTVNRHVFSGSSVTALNRGSWSAAASQILAEASPVNVAARATLDFATRQMTIVVEAYYTGNSNADTNMLNIAILQDNIIGQQGGASGNPDQVVAGGKYRHMHMLRDLVTGQWGQEITTTTEGSFYTQTFNYTVPQTITGDNSQTEVFLDDLDVIVFIAEGHQEILTGCQAEMTYLNAQPLIKDLKEVVVQNCDMEFGAKATLKNLSETAITSAALTYTIDNVSETYNWTGNVAAGASVDIELPVISGNFNNGQAYDLNVEFTGLNGESFNGGSRTVQVSKEVYTAAGPFEFVLKTDQYGSETSFEFRKADGTVVLAKGPFSNAVRELRYGFDPAEAGCYILEVYDSYGDGINNGYGAGYFTLSNADGQVFHNNGKFGDLARYFINVTNNGSGNMDINSAEAAQFNLYPNPVSDFAVIEANSTIREVRVVNALGQQIYTNTNVNNSQLRINTESFAAGLYIVTIKTNEGVATKRVSVVK